MKNFRSIDVKDFSCDPFQKIGNEWFLITAEKNKKVNTMTASFGGLGIFWNHNVVFIFIKGARYTKEFIDESDTFSISFYDTEKYRKDMTYLGSVSGRDENKIEKVGFTIVHEDEIPYFEEANTVLLCKKLSSHHLAPEGILNPEILKKWYSDGKGYHNMYVGQILRVLEAE